jgi:hypothetical protein
MTSRCRRVKTPSWALYVLVLSGCGGPFLGPTNSPDIYTGTWSGEIGTFTVVMDVQATRGVGFGLSGNVRFNGTDSTQGTMFLSGIGTVTGTRLTLNFFQGDVVASLFQGQVTGEMVGGRAIVGQFQGPCAMGRGYDGVLAIENAEVTFLKQ